MQVIRRYFKSPLSFRATIYYAYVIYSTYVSVGLVWKKEIVGGFTSVSEPDSQHWYKTAIADCY